MCTAVCFVGIFILAMKVKACVRVYCSVFARTSLAPCPIMREVPVSIAVDAAHLCSPQNALIVLAKLFVDHVLRVMHSPPLPRRCPVPRVAPVPQTVVSENPLGACQGAPLGSADCVCFALHPPPPRAFPHNRRRVHMLQWFS